MSYQNDFNEEQRQREYERQEAHKININLWPEQMVDSRSSGQQPGCDMCHRVLVVSKKDPSKYMCPDCGNLTDIVPSTQQQPKPRKFKPKQNANPSLIIQSQTRKTKRRIPLGSPPTSDDSNEELRRELGLESLDVIASNIQAQET